MDTRRPITTTICAVSNTVAPIHGNSGPIPLRMMTAKSYLAGSSNTLTRQRASPTSIPKHLTRQRGQWNSLTLLATEPWCLHLSYIKPHWPYIVPAPYHDMYSAKHVIPVVRSDEERRNAHPLLNAYYQHRFSRVFNREGVRESM